MPDKIYGPTSMQPTDNGQR